MNLFIVFMFACFSFFDCVYSQNQIQQFNGFAQHSWKTQRRDIGNQNHVTIEEYLVRVFKAEGWRTGVNSRKINIHIPDLDNVIAIGNPTGHDWQNIRYALYSNDSPREWIQKLNLREINKFRNLINNNLELINNDNFGTDDLVKARAISGTFWQISPNHPPVRAFSGMLVPGQAYNFPIFRVYTCMHGFQKNTPHDEFYFVPYGVSVLPSKPDSQNFVTRKGFKVTHVTHFRDSEQGTILPISDLFFAPGSEEMQLETLYSQNDFAIATIESRTAPYNGHQRTLRNILASTNLNFIVDAEENDALPEFGIEQQNNDPLLRLDNNMLFNSAHNRLFVIGFASQTGIMELDHGIAISTNLKNEGLQGALRRSLRDDENIKFPNHIGRKANEYTSSIPAYPGMSGGPILKCRLNFEDPGRKECSIFGTVWGEERAFNCCRILTGFSSFINTPSNHSSEASECGCVCS